MALRKCAQGRLEKFEERHAHFRSYPAVVYISVLMFAMMALAESLTVPQLCEKRLFGYKIQDPEDCHSFYVCLGNWGQYNLECGQGYRFNETLQKCIKGKCPPCPCLKSSDETAAETTGYIPAVPVFWLSNSQNAGNGTLAESHEAAVKELFMALNNGSSLIDWLIISPDLNITALKHLPNTLDLRIARITQKQVLSDLEVMNSSTNFNFTKQQTIAKDLLGRATKFDDLKLPSQAKNDEALTASRVISSTDFTTEVTPIIDTIMPTTSVAETTQPPTDLLTQIPNELTTLISVEHTTQKDETTLSSVTITHQSSQSFTEFSKEFSIETTLPPTINVFKTATEITTEVQAESTIVLDRTTAINANPETKHGATKKKLLGRAAKLDNPKLPSNTKSYEALTALSVIPSTDFTTEVTPIIETTIPTAPVAETTQPHTDLMTQIPTESITLYPVEHTTQKEFSIETTLPPTTHVFKTTTELNAEITSKPETDPETTTNLATEIIPESTKLSASHKTTELPVVTETTALLPVESTTNAANTAGSTAPTTDISIGSTLETTILTDFPKVSTAETPSMTENNTQATKRTDLPDDTTTGIVVATTTPLPEETTTKIASTTDPTTPTLNPITESVIETTTGHPKDTTTETPNMTEETTQATKETDLPAETTDTTTVGTTKLTTDIPKATETITETPSLPSGSTIETTITDTTGFTTQPPTTTAATTQTTITETSTIAVTGLPTELPESPNITTTETTNTPTETTTENSTTFTTESPTETTTHPPAESTTPYPTTKLPNTQDTTQNTTELTTETSKISEQTTTTVEATTQPPTETTTPLPAETTTETDEVTTTATASKLCTTKLITTECKTPAQSISTTSTACKISAATTCRTITTTCATPTKVTTPCTTRTTTAAACIQQQTTAQLSKNYNNGNENGQIEAEMNLVCSQHQGIYFIKHPTQCNRYYSCYRKRAYPQICPGRFKFDEKLQLCNFPAAVDCPKPELEDKNRKKSSQRKLYSSAGLKPGDCRTLKSGTFVRDPSDCNKYYVCLNGSAVALHCPRGQCFDIEKYVCNFKALVKNCSV